MIGRTVLLAISAIIIVPLVLTLYIYVMERGVMKMGYMRREKLRPWLWLLPAFILLGVFLIYPVVNTFVLSFMNGNLTKFIGFRKLPLHFQ